MGTFLIARRKSQKENEAANNTHTEKTATAQKLITPQPQPLRQRKKRQLYRRSDIDYCLFHDGLG